MDQRTQKKIEKLFSLARCPDEYARQCIGGTPEYDDDMHRVLLKICPHWFDEKGMVIRKPLITPPIDINVKIQRYLSGKPITENNWMAMGPAIRFKKYRCSKCGWEGNEDGATKHLKANGTEYTKADGTLRDWNDINGCPKCGTVLDVHYEEAK